MNASWQGPQHMRDDLDRLADLLLFREQLSEDPRAALERHGLVLPDEVIAALADMSPEELGIVSQVHRRLSEVVRPGGGDLGRAAPQESVGIFF